MKLVILINVSAKQVVGTEDSEMKVVQTLQMRYVRSDILKLSFSSQLALLLAMLSYREESPNGMKKLLHNPSTFFSLSETLL